MSVRGANDGKGKGEITADNLLELTLSLEIKTWGTIRTRVEGWVR